MRRAITMGKNYKNVILSIRPHAEKLMLTEDCAIAFGASRIRKQVKGTLIVPLLGVEKGFTVEIL